MKKTLSILIALLTVFALVFCGCAPATGDNTPSSDGTPETEGSSTATDSSTQVAGKSFTVTVVHKDGTEKTFNYTTSEEKLGPALVKEGLIVESNSPGMYTTVDGETADWNVDQSYWAFYVGSDYAMQGMDDTSINDGDVFKLVYTVG